MANTLTVSTSYKAVLDTSSTVGNQTYNESALDQVVATNTGLITATYDENLASLTKGVCCISQSYVTPIVSEGFWEVGYDLVGTEPAITDKIQVLFVKAGQLIGQTDNYIGVKCGPIVMARLTPGQACQLFFDETTQDFDEITLWARHYIDGVDEIQCTVALIGA